MGVSGPLELELKEIVCGQVYWEGNLFLIIEPRIPVNFQALFKLLYYSLAYNILVLYKSLFHIALVLVSSHHNLPITQPSHFNPA